MLSVICQDLRNWFCENGDIYAGNYKIINGQLALPFLQNGQYFRIVGSVFNDGVYKYGECMLNDEEFKGAIWAMKVPPGFVQLVEEIEDYNKVSNAQNNSPYVSESWGGYSYTKATDESGAPISWQSVFAKRLNQWRKL